MLRVSSQILNFLAEFLDGKPFAQGLQNRLRDGVRHPQFLKLPPEDGFIVGCGRDVVRSRDVARGMIDGNFPLAIDDARPKRDRRDVAFARRAQAEDETQRTCGKSILVRMRNDGGIKERRRLQRIFVREVSADKKFAFLGERLVGWKQMPDRIKANEKVVVKSLMARFEFGEDLRQHLDGLGLG